MLFVKKLIISISSKFLIIIIIMSEDLFPPNEDLDINRLKDRVTNFQKHFTVDFYKTTAEKFAVELRKSHRADQTAKRRALLGPTKLSPIFTQNFKGAICTDQIPISLIQLYPELANQDTPPIEKLGILCKTLVEIRDDKPLIECLITLQDILGYDNEMNSEIFFRMGFVQLFIKFMNSNKASILLPATVCMTNLTAADHYYITSMVHYGAINAFLNVITANSLIICALAIKGIANIAVDSLEFFHLIKSEAVFGKINNVLNESKEVHADLYMSLSFYILAITHNCKSFTKSDFEYVFKWIERIIEITDPGIVTDVLKALLNISMESQVSIKSRPILQYLIIHANQSLALNIILNISYYSNTEAEYFNQDELLERLVTHTYSTGKCKKFAFQCLNNILLSSQDRNHVLSWVRDEFVNSISNEDKAAKKECIYFFYNFSQMFTFETWLRLNQAGLMEKLNECLDPEEDVQIINCSLYILFQMFFSSNIHRERSQTVNNQIIDEFEEREYVQSIETLCSHDNIEISEFATDIFEEYFTSYAACQDSLNDQVSTFKFS